MLLGSANEEDRRVFRDSLAEYADARNICPFLKDGACVIYEVRPYVCAGVVSASEPEMCAPGQRRNSPGLLYKADFLPQNDDPYFMPTACGVNFGCMPELVHQILAYGYAFLSTIGGLENMKRLAAEDPEVQRTLEMMGMRMGQ